MTNAQPGQITRYLLIAFGLFAGTVALWFSRDIMMLTLSAVVLALLITTPVRFFVNHGLRRSMAISLTLILILAGIIISAALVLPGLIDQFRQLIAILTRVLSSGTQVLPYSLRLDATDLGVLLRRAMQLTPPLTLPAGLSFLSEIDFSTLGKQLSEQVLNSLSAIPSQVFPFVGGVASVLLSILIVVFMGIYFVTDPETYQRGAIRLLPKRYRTRALEVMAKLEASLRRFLQVQLLIMVMTGLTTGLALFLMGVPLAGALGTITGLFSFIPNFGPLVAIVPILGVVIINAPAKIIVVVAVFYALQLLINQFIAPLLMGQETNIPPVLIILAQVLAGLFFGFLGLLLSVPLCVIVVVLVREVYIRDVLNDREADRPPIPEPTRAPQPVSEREPTRA